MKKLLLLLLLLPSLAFGQATGYVLSNFASSGSIGTAAATVDEKTRININQTTASVTLTVPNPTNTSTKVTEVWIGNIGSVPFTLTPGGTVSPATAVILKWTGAAWYVVGTQSATGNFIKTDGSSDATTGKIKIGDNQGFVWDGGTLGELYNQGGSLRLTGSSNIEFRSPSGYDFYSPSSSSKVTHDYSLAGSDYTAKWPNKSGVDTIAMLSDLSSIDVSNKISLDGTSPATTGYIATGNGYGLQSPAGSSISLDAFISLQASSNITNIAGDGTYQWMNTGGVLGRLNFESLSADRTYTWPNKNGTVAMTSDVPIGLTAASPLSYNSGTGVISIPAANGSTNGYLPSTDWTTFNNKQSTFPSQAANLLYSGPASGSSATPAFRALQYADLNNGNTVATNAEYNDAVSAIAISCWGDSETGGNNGGYPKTLSTVSLKSTLNFGIPGNTSTQIKDRFLLATDTWNNSTIIWAGTNNINQQSTILADIATMVSSFAHQRYIIIGVMVGSTQGNPSTAFTQITNINSALSAAYGARFFDVNAYMLTQGNGSTQDNTDIAAGIVPSSLRQDAIHLNPTGQALVATRINSNFIQYLKASSSKVITTDNISSANYNNYISGGVINAVGGGSLPSLGTELVSNGSFSGLTGWTNGGGWAASGGTAVHTPGSTATLSQSITLPIGRIIVSFTVTQSTNTFNILTLGSLPGQLIEYVSGTYYFGFNNPTASTQALTFTPSSNFDGAITAVSAKQAVSTVPPQVTINDLTSDIDSRVEIRSSRVQLRNTYVGTGSGQYNYLGAGNSALGAYALAYNVSGTNITAVGNQAGFNTINAASSTFLGSSAGYNSLNNNSCTFSGASSGFNSTADFNTFNGALSGYENTTGGLNTFNGYQSGKGNTTGLSNVAIGANAKVGTAQSYNVIISPDGGTNLTTGTGGNTVVGYGSGIAMTTAPVNTFLGIQCGNGTTTGGANLFAGYQCGGANTTGNGNIVLGFNNNTFAGPTVSGQLNIGNVLYGLNLYSTGGNSATPTATGSIGVGVSSITARLHLPAGTATASTAPLKFTSGTNLTTTEAGAVEYNGSHLYFTATNAGTRHQLDNQILAGQYTATGTATTTYTVTIGSTQANTTYKTNVTPTNALTAVMYYVTNKTTTTFDVTFVTGLTGAVAFDWMLVP